MLYSLCCFVACCLALYVLNSIIPPLNKASSHFTNITLFISTSYLSILKIECTIEIINLRCYLLFLSLISFNFVHVLLLCMFLSVVAVCLFIYQCSDDKII